jgi:predicted N-acetyltransferase YhbS
LEITQLTESDFPAAGQVLDIAYEGTNLVNALVKNFSVQPDGWFCAKNNGQLVGIVGAANYGHSASIGMVAVHPLAQNRGVGSRLMKRLMTRITEEWHCTSAFLDATPVGIPLYKSVGFVEMGKTFQLERSALNTTILPSATAIRLLAATDQPGILELDRSIIGGNRRVVFDMLWRNYPDRTFVAQDEQGAITGYIVAQTRLIGPWMALTPQIAELLLIKAQTPSFAVTPAVNTPDSNQDALSILDRHGFTIHRTTHHMIFDASGTSIDHRDLSRLFGQVSFMFG